jgi:PIN domain nuclease of toxin-antitoxin system
VNVLLDTATFLWIGAGSPRLSKAARAIVVDRSNRLFFSAVGAWEIHLKTSLGKLPLPTDAASYIARTRAAREIDALEFTEADAAHLSTLPFYHRDPFDRALISQATARSLTILTPDPAFREYSVTTIW